MYSYQYMDAGCYFILCSESSAPPGDQKASLHNDHILFTEELLQHTDDAAGFGKVAVFSSSVLQQHISVSTALQEEAAAEQGVVAHFCLTDKALQVVHVLDGLFLKHTQKQGNTELC